MKAAPSLISSVARGIKPCTAARDRNSGVIWADAASTPCLRTLCCSFMCNSSEAPGATDKKIQLPFRALHLQTRPAACAPPPHLQAFRVESARSLQLLGSVRDAAKRRRRHRAAARAGPATGLARPRRGLAPLQLLLEGCLQVAVAVCGGGSRASGPPSLGAPRHTGTAAKGGRAGDQASTLSAPAPPSLGCSALQGASCRRAAGLGLEQNACLLWH